MTRPSWFTILRDTTAYIGGWLLIFKQAGIFFDPPAQANETLILVAGALIGVPGIAQIIAWRAGTGGQPSEPAPPASPASPLPSSSGTSEASP